MVKEFLTVRLFSQAAEDIFESITRYRITQSVGSFSSHDRDDEEASDVRADDSPHLGHSQGLLTTSSPDPNGDSMSADMV